LPEGRQPGLVRRHRRRSGFHGRRVLRAAGRLRRALLPGPKNAETDC
jgi:hypothetical protein